MRLYHTSKGIITLEILIALTVIVLSITGAILVSLTSQTLSLDAQLNTEALSQARAGLETARALSRENFTSLSSSTTTEGIYQRVISVRPMNSFSNMITSRVTWNAAGDRPQKTELTTLLADWKSSLGGSTCSETLAGNWGEPQLLGHADIVSGATGIDVRNKKAYLTSDPSAGPAEDFFIFDVSDPNAPVLLSKLNTGPGLMSVRVVGAYAYVANKSVNGQLQVIDISNPRAPFVAKTFKIPGVTGSGGGGVGNTIFYAKKTVYLGLTKTATGPEFNRIDVSTPLNPIYRSGWRTNTKINSIVVKDDTAYLATPMPTPASPTRENLSILNVADPARMSRLGTFTAPDPAIQDGTSVALVGSMLYFGRTIGGVTQPANHEFFSLDVSNPATVSGRWAIDVGASVNAIIMRGARAFVAAGDPAPQFQIWNTDPPLPPRLYASTAIGQTSVGSMDCEGNTIYLAQRGSRALQIIGPKT